MIRIIFGLWLVSLAAVVPLSEASAAVDPAFSTRDQPFSKNVEKLLGDAQKAMKAGKTEDGLRLLNLANNLEPNNPYVVARFATALNMVGYYQDALTRLQKARKIGASDDVVLGPMLDAMLSMGQNQKVLDLFPDPGSSTTYSAGMILRARASALQVLHDRAGASAAMKRSLAILNDYDGTMTAARIELMQGNLDAAESRVNAALKFKPGDVDAQMLTINLAMRRQMPARAQAMVEKLVADNPGSVSALLMRIKIYMSTDRTDKAGPDIDRILAQMPAMPLARYFKAIQLARHNDIKGAWDVAHSLSRDYLEADPGVAVNVANIAVLAGYPDSGASILNVVVQHFPWLLEARLELVDLRLRQNSLQYAVNALAIVRDSKDPRIAALFARIALMKRDSLGAQKFIRQAIEAGGGEELRILDKDVALKSLSDYLALHPDNKLVKKQYAILLLGFGELAKAKAVYEQVVREDPADAVALNNLSWLAVKDDPARALALAKRAVQADPRSANNLDTLGCMQMNRSDPQGAVESLQRAHDMQPDNAGIFYHLALAHEASGNGAQSQAILQTLVKRGGFSDLEAAKTLLSSKLKMAGQMSR